MTLFGMNRAIEYIEREINNIEYAKEKEEIRKHGTNTMVLIEKFLKELLYTYIYYFDRDRYYSIVNDLNHTEEILMFGKILSELNKLHYYIKDNIQLKKFNEDFNRTFVVFKYKDKYLDILYQCSQLRGMLLHDGIKGISSLKEYKDNTSESMIKALQTLKHFKDNNISPNIVKYKDYVVASDNNVLMNFVDEIGSVIPVSIGKSEIEKYQNKIFYLFSKNSKHILIPVTSPMNYLSDEVLPDKCAIEDNPQFNDATVAPLGMLRIIESNVSYGLNNNNIYIGRSPDNDIVIQRRSISRKHCVILIKNNKAYLQDLGSSFGTILNMLGIEQFKEYEIHPNDIIKIGIGVEETCISYCK